jgi:hypothetical protein
MRRCGTIDPKTLWNMREQPPANYGILATAASNMMASATHTTARRHPAIFHQPRWHASRQPAVQAESYRHLTTNAIEDAWSSNVGSLD